MYRVFLLLSLVSSTFAALRLDSPCPEVEPFKNFDINKFHKGKWHEAARYSNELEKAGDCVTFEHYTENGERKIRLNEIVDNKLKSMEGIIDFDEEKGKEGIVEYVSRAITDSEKMELFQLRVLDVDYDRYSIMYGCSEDAENIRHEYVWITSRTPQLDTKTKEAIDSFLEKSTLVKKEKLIWDHFDEETCKIS